MALQPGRYFSNLRRYLTENVIQQPRILNKSPRVAPSNIISMLLHEHKGTRPCQLNHVGKQIDIYRLCSTVAEKLIWRRPVIPSANFNSISLVKCLTITRSASILLVYDISRLVSVRTKSPHSIQHKKIPGKISRFWANPRWRPPP